MRESEADAHRQRAVLDRFQFDRGLQHLNSAGEETYK